MWGGTSFDVGVALILRGAKARLLRGRFQKAERGNTVEYADYLKSDQWKEISRRRRETDNFSCVCCGATENLNVHHVRYPHDWFQTREDDLRTVCKDCHVMVHRLKEQFDMCSKFLTYTKNGFIEQNGSVYQKMVLAQEAIMARECWKRNLFASADNRRFINNVREIVNYERQVAPIDIERVWKLLAFVKDCFIENSEPKFNKSKRKAKALSRTRFK
jgi:hypothetical protein